MFRGLLWSPLTCLRQTANINGVVKKSHLLRCSDFLANQNTTCMIFCLKNHYALYMELLT